MLWGFFLKIVLADRIAMFVDTVYLNYSINTGFYILVATILFAVQIYCDFSGYSVIAIGTAEILGVRLMENFNAPYLSRSVAEFWRNWHISLTSWFKDYLYIPLGGNRRGKLRKYMNIMIVFLVSAVWHNTTLPFVLWGAVHGGCLFIEKYFNVKGNVLYSFWIIILISFLWQCFKVESLSVLVATIIHSTQWESIHPKLLLLFIMGVSITVFADSRRIRELIYTNPKQKSDIKTEVLLFSLMLTLTLLYPHNININFFYLRF